MVYAWQKQYPCLGLVLEAWEQHHSPIVKQINPEVLFIDYKKLPKNYKLQLPTTSVAVYEVGNITLAEQLFANNITYVETFCIGELLNAIK